MNDETMRVFCIAPRWLGDAVLARRAVFLLGRCGVAIEILGRGVSARVLEDLPGVVRVHTVPDASRIALFRKAQSLRPIGFTGALVLPGSMSSAWAAFLAGATVRVGHGSMLRRFLLTRSVARPERNVHLSLQGVQLAKTLVDELRRQAKRSGKVDALPSDPSIQAWDPPLLRVRPREAREARRLLESHAVSSRARPLVVAPGARFGPAKRYPAERFAAAARRLSQSLGAPVLLVGARSDREQAMAVRRELPGAIDLTGQTSLGGLIGILGSSAGLLANDSGAMHLAAALGVVVVGVFGSTEPEWTRPLGPRAGHVQNPVWCSPCYGRTCAQDFACMLDLPAERLVDTFLVLADSRTPEPGGNVSTAVERSPKPTLGGT